MADVFFRSGFNYDRDAVSLETGLRCEDASLTKQSFLEETDINTIIRRFNLSGALPEGVRMPTYVDYEGVFDFHSAMNAVAQAGEAFDAMPAHVRTRFNNDPGAFVDFCNDPANAAEALKMGLVDPVAAVARAAPAAPAVTPTLPVAAPAPVVEPQARDAAGRFA